VPSQAASTLGGMDVVALDLALEALALLLEA